jgi:hypothetical protein
MGKSAQRLEDGIG